MEQPTVNANSKTGAYPFADLPNLFGNLYFTFFTHPDPNARAKAYEGIHGIAKAVAIKRKDSTYLELCKTKGTDGSVDVTEQVEIVWDAFRVLFEDGTYTKPTQPFAYLKASQ